MNSEILQKIIEKWKGENIEITSPYSEKQIQNSFDKIGKPVTKDILQVYTSVGGIAEYDMDNNLLSFWTLEELVSENLKFQTDFTLFGDFLIFSYLYGYKYENESVSSVYSNCDYDWKKFSKVADSVEEFFDLYLNNPFEIGLYKE